MDVTLYKMINNLATGRLSRVMKWRMYETEDKPVK